MDTTHRDRPSSPASLASDSELVALPIDCLIYDSPRPLSPQTIDSVEEVVFCLEGTEIIVFNPEPLNYVTSPLFLDQPSSIPNRTGSPIVIQTSKTSLETRDSSMGTPDCQKMPGLTSEDLTYIDKRMHYESETGSISTLQTTVSEEDIQKDSVKPSALQDTKGQILYVIAGDLTNKTVSVRVRLRA